MAADPTSSFKLPYLGGSGSSLGWTLPMAVPIEPIVDDWAFSDVNIEEILHDYRQNPDAFIPGHRALNRIETFLFLNQHPEGLAAGGVPGLKFTNGGLAGRVRDC